MNNTGKERARRYREKLAADGGRTCAFYLDGANDRRLKELMDAHGLGQGDAIKFAIHLAHAATFADEAEPTTTDEQPSTADTGHPKQGVLPGVESQATQETIDNTKHSNADEATTEPTLDKIADATTWSGAPEGRPTLPKEMLARWLEHRRGDGWTLQAMSDALNNAGIPTSMGKTWKRGAVDTFIRNYCKK